MKKFAFFIIILVSLSQCTSDNEEDLYPVESNECATDSMNYEQDIAFIINSNCAIPGCHIAGGQPPNYENYQATVDNKNGIQRRVIDQQTMPPSGPLSNCNLDKLQAWLDDNTPEN